ncbi:hypothetical protein IX57_12105 [Paracoccus sanguinis]|nr:hypothetical protein IX57_12105 [Paracoccus sanguinis]
MCGVTPPDIAALEAQRYAAMLAGDVDRLRVLLSERLHYSHSLGDQDSRDSLLARIGAGDIIYHEVTAPVAWTERLADAVLLGGRMTARATVSGVPRSIDNAFLAVWAIEDDGHWRLIAYQPTPLPH